jgi:Glycosyltransferase family 87
VRRILSTDVSTRWLLLLSLSLVAAASMWLYSQYVLLAYQQSTALAKQRPRGNLSDLYPRWLGARELLVHHRDPYTAEITREIQIGYYGRPLDPTRKNDPIDQQGFAYPIYVVLMLAPTVTLPFSTVHRIFFWLFVVLTTMSVPLWLGTLRWRLSRAATVVAILLTLGCFPAIQGLRLQQLTVLVVALIAGAMYAITRRRFVLAGMLLALASIKPQLVFLLILWLCIWLLGNWRERHHLLWSLVISMAVLVVAGELLLPGWISEFRAAMKDYYRYTGGGNSLLNGFLPPLWAQIASMLLVGMVLVFAWRNRRASEDTPAFQWLLCFTLATTLVVIPMFAPYNQLLLLPGVMMALRARKELLQSGHLSRFFCWMTAGSIGFPFLTAACLVTALAFLPGTTVQKAWGLPFYPSFAIPITTFGLLLVSRGDLSCRESEAGESN